MDSIEDVSGVDGVMGGGGGVLERSGGITVEGGNAGQTITSETSTGDDEVEEWSVAVLVE